MFSAFTKWQESSAWAGTNIAVGVAIAADSMQVFLTHP